jgi:ferredoxin-like protein FixX
MRVDGTFIGIEVSDDAAGDAQIAAKLAEVCPVDIFADDAGQVQIVEGNVDECVLCHLCIDATGGPDRSPVRVLKLYDNEASLA